MLSDDELSAFESFALDLNAAAGEAALPFFRRPLDIENKVATGFDPVTEADRGAERAIRALIAARYPTHGVIGEEYGEDRADAEFVWVLDPVDGTRSFVAGLPLWTHLIALRWRGQPVVGVIGQSYIGEVFVGSRRGSRHLRAGIERVIRVRSCDRLDDAVIAASDPEAYFSSAERGAWRQVRAAARFARLGGAAYLFAMVAQGTIDLVVESGLKTWDAEAAVPLIEGAGGIVLNWRGERLGRDGGQVLAAGDQRCLDQALVALRQAAA